MLDGVDTDVLEAAQTQEVVRLYQHGALCRLISPAKKQDIIVQASCFEVLHKRDDAHLRGALFLPSPWAALEPCRGGLLSETQGPLTFTALMTLESTRESTSSGSHREAQWFAQD